MSIQYGKLCSIIIKQFFGESTQLVADALFHSVSRTLAAILKATGLQRSDATLALAVLINFQLVKFEPSVGNETIAEYSLRRENILNILRYPKYISIIETKYGNIGVAIVEEFLRSGARPASVILLKCFSNPSNKEKLAKYKDVLFRLIGDNYLIRTPIPKKVAGEEEPSVPILEMEPTYLFVPPNIDLSQLTQIHSGKKIQASDADIFWQVNFDRFHQDFRDNIMVSAIERKLGANAGECFKFILELMYERTDPWQQNSSNPFTFVEIKQAIEKHSNNSELTKYVDQYVSLIAEDNLKFLRKTSEMGGGQYVIEMKKAFEELAICCTEHVIAERFGSKASRIFRVIKMKKYIEQEDIQKEAMIPAKEAKLFTYKLFEEQFIQTKTIKKSGGGGSGQPKSFYLFHVNYLQVMRMLLDISYKALYNVLTRCDYERFLNKRLIDKSQKIEKIIEVMKERGESDEYITEILESLTPPEREILEKVKVRIRTFSLAELAVLDTIFLLQMYIFYNSSNKK